MDEVEAEASRTRPRDRDAILASAAGHPRGLLDSVRRRLLLVVALALMPIAGLNFVQGVMQLNAAEAEARQRLLQHAASAAGVQENVFASAENVLHALKNVEDVHKAAATCHATLQGAVVSLPFASNIIVLDKAGKVICSALPTRWRDVSTAPWWRAGMANARFSLSGRIESGTSDAEVLIGLLPLPDVAGRIDGAVAMGIDAAFLDNLLKREAPPAEGVVALFSASGAQLVSNAWDKSRVLFAHWHRRRPDAPLAEARDETGRRWTFATAPLGRNGLMVAFAMPTEKLFRWTALTVAASFALPTLIVVFSLIALWAAMDRIVLRWLLYLRRVTAVYAQGHYGFRPNRLKGAPSEFRVLGQAVEEMASAVRQRDARLRESLAEKTALVREIHHRIKNSLQMVVSLLSLYGSGIERGEDRRRFEQLRTRVNTLALVHRILYEASNGSKVHLNELLWELAGLIEGAGEQPLHITVEAEDALLPTDMAVPLALMVVELMASLAEGLPGTPALHLSGALRDRQLIITARAPRGRGAAATFDLAHGFAGQLGGTLAFHEAAGERVVTGEFPCRGAGH